MIDFLKRKRAHLTMPKLEVDLHSHLIPGIDDGSKTVYESIKIIRRFKNLGYRKLITTPHIMAHRYNNSREHILEKLEDLKDALMHYELDMELDAAAEYYLDDHFLKLLRKKEILTIGEKRVLFEMSYTCAPTNLADIIFEIQDYGYQPLLAHPERYLFFHEDFEQYSILKEYGVEFQLNLNSLAGQYGKSIQHTAQLLVESGLVDFLGSDVHKEKQIHTLHEVLNSRFFKKIFTHNKILNNTLL